MMHEFGAYIILFGTLLNIVIALFLKGSTRYNGIFGINPLLIAGGFQLAGGLASLLRKPPKAPDFFSPAVNEALRSRGRVQELLERQGGILEANLAARGVSGSGGAGDREALIRAATSGVADIDATLADLITNAGNRQRQAEFDIAQQRFANRQQAISQLANAGTSIATLSATTGTPLFSSGNPIAVGPSAQAVTDVNVQSQLARTLPEGFFSPQELRPSVDPLTRIINFGL